MTFKHVSLGMNLSHTSGKVTYFHDECAVKFNGIIGDKAERTDDLPPKDAKCPWCGKPIEEKSE